MTLYKNKNLLKLAIILSVFFGFFLGFNNGNVSATSHTVTINSVVDSENPVDLCDSFDCSSLQHITFDWNYSSESSCQIMFQVKSGGSSQQLFFYPSLFKHGEYSTYNWRSINSIIYSRSSFCSDAFSAGATASFTLSDTIPSSPSGSLSIDENGIFDVANYASVSVNVPQDVTEVVEDPISNDFQKVFFAIVENIIPAFGILLVVWFGIDMLSSLIFGRGR